MGVHTWLLHILSNPDISEHAAVTATVVARALVDSERTSVKVAPTEGAVYALASELAIPTVQIEQPKIAV